MLNAPLRILIVAALCVAALIGLVVREGMARDAGSEFLLAMAAIDPRSLLSGHYVIVDIREPSTIEAPCAPPEPTARWIGFAPNGQIVAGARVYSAVSATPERSDASVVPETLVVRGGMTCSPPIPAQGDIPAIDGWVGVDIGISRFYINQAEAVRIERIMREQNADEATRVYAIVSVGGDGRARLKGLMVDEARLDLGWD